MDELSKTVLLVDDHKIVRDGIKAMLIGESDFRVVGEAGDSQTFFQLLKSVIPDIVVLDLKLPGASGLDISEQLKSQSYSMKILILTAEASESIVRQCIRIGVDGILSKESGREVYLEALRSVAQDKPYYSGQFMGLLTSRNSSTDSDVQLSPREVDVLKGFAEGMSYKEIAAKLEMSSRTVETHKLNIQKKLNLQSLADLIKYAVREGIVRL